MCTLGQADIKPLVTIMRYAQTLDPLGIALGPPSGAVLGALIGYLVGGGGSFLVVSMGFGTLGITSYLALVYAAYLFAHRNAPDILEDSVRASSVRILATMGGLALGMLVGEHWQNPWTILIGGAVGVEMDFWSATILPGIAANRRKVRAQRS